MTKFNQGLFLIVATMATFGLAQNVHAEDLPPGLKVSTSLWDYAYDENGARDNVYQSSLNKNEQNCSNHLRDQILERAKSNPQLNSLVGSGKYLLQIDISSAFDGNAYVDAIQDSTLIYDKKHMYIRIPLREFFQLSFKEERNCNLPEVFNEKFPALVPNIAQALTVLNPHAAQGEKFSIRKEKGSGVGPATCDVSDGTSQGVKPAGHF
jgi:hypothetical protein